MLVNKIGFFSNFQTQNKNNLNNEKAKQGAPIRETYAMPVAAHYVSNLNFTGGYSINLEETIENLEKYENTHGIEIFPLGVKEKAKEVIESGNPDDLTLIDVHKQVYSDVLDIDSLEDLKLFYPEFQNVKSIHDTNFNEGSFIDRVQNNELEHFNPKNELGLDLVKLLYAQGLSTNDIKSYTGGKNIYYSALKLGVPILNQQYAHVLKFSDKEYNKRLATLMSNNRKDAKERRAQSGEPVFIPRGPLTKEHKEHISEGLKKYYEENPEKAFDISKRQREFFEANPDKAEIFSEVMELTWKKSYSLKKALSKYFKKELGREVNSAELNPLTIEGENRNIMKSFWEKNPWAKEEFSKNMTLSWAKAKENDIKYHTIKNSPKGFIEDFEKWKKAKGIEEESCFNPVCRDSGFENLDKIARNQKLVTKFCDENVLIQDVMADTYSAAVFDLREHIMKEHKTFSKEVQAQRQAFLEKMDADLQNLQYKEFLTTEEAANLYFNTYMTCVDLKFRDYLDFASQRLDENYIKYKKMHNAEAIINS